MTAEYLDPASTLLGYLGAALIILAYFLNQKRWLSSEDWRYPALNLLGAGLVIFSLCFHFNAPSMVIEIFWAAISLYGIRSNIRTARQARGRR